MAPTESVCLDSTPRPRCARPKLVDLRPARSSRSWCLGHHTPLGHRSAHSTWPLGGGGQRRARYYIRIHRTRQHAHQPSATLAQHRPAMTPASIKSQTRSKWSASAPVYLCTVGIHHSPKSTRPHILNKAGHDSCRRNIHRLHNWCCCCLSQGKLVRQMTRTLAHQPRFHLRAVSRTRGEERQGPSRTVWDIKFNSPAVRQNPGLVDSVARVAPAAFEHVEPVGHNSQRHDDGTS